MATVYVDSWADFLDAIQVSGDDVILPENEVWDMNDIAPEGVGSLPTILCSSIDGRGTEIRNLHTDGRFYSDSHVLQNVSDLHFTNFILGGSSLFETWHNTRDGVITFTGCKFSGLCGTQTKGVLLPGIGNYGDDYGVIRADRCSFVVDAQRTGYFYAARDMRYCRVHVAVPNGYLQMSAPQWSYLRIDQPTTTALLSYGALACVFDGEMGNVISAGEPASTYPSIFCSDSIPGLASTDHLIGVTRQQLYQPEYLASIGFPIGYDPPEE